MREHDERGRHSQTEQRGERMDEREEQEEDRSKGALPRIRSFVEQKDRNGENQEPERFLRYGTREQEERSEYRHEQPCRKAHGSSARRLHGRKVRGQHD